MSRLKEAISAVGGVGRAASICGVSPRAVYKWVAAGGLPRTDFTGETNYAERLSTATNRAFEPEWLLEKTAPRRLPSTETKAA